MKYEGFAIDEVDLELTDNPLEIVTGGRKMGLLTRVPLYSPKNAADLVESSILYPF